METTDNKNKAGPRWNVLVTPAVVFMFAIIFLTFLQVCLRYIFNHSLAWIEEVSRYLFVWIVFLGSVIAFQRRVHIRIDFIDQILSPRMDVAFSYLIALINVLGVGLLLYSGVLVAWRNRGASFYTLPDLPILVMYIAVPLCCLLMIFIIIRGVFKDKSNNDTGS